MSAPRRARSSWLSWLASCVANRVVKRTFKYAGRNAIPATSAITATAHIKAFCFRLTNRNIIANRAASASSAERDPARAKLMKIGVVRRKRDDLSDRT